MFLPNIFATGDDDISLVETYFCITVEVLNFMGYFVKYWNKNEFTILTILYLNPLHFNWAIVLGA